MDAATSPPNTRGAAGPTLQPLPGLLPSASVLRGTQPGGQTEQRGLGSSAASWGSGEGRLFQSGAVTDPRPLKATFTRTGGDRREGATHRARGDVTSNHRDRLRDSAGIESGDSAFPTQNVTFKQRLLVLPSRSTGRSADGLKVFSAEIGFLKSHCEHDEF